MSLCAVGSKDRKRRPLQVWHFVKNCLPSSLKDQIEFWWHFTGRQLAHLLEAAGYSPEKQYEVLLFHYHWIVSPRFSLVCTNIPYSLERP